MNTTKEQALERLNAIEKEQKELRRVIENFDKPCNIMDKIKSMKDVYNHLGISECDILLYKNPKTKREISTNAHVKLTLMIEVLNQGWIKDWNNSSEYYYTPYFNLSNDSFSYYYYDLWHTYSRVGFGLGFNNKELLLHAVKYFLNEYKQYYKGEF